MRMRRWLAIGVISTTIFVGGVGVSAEPGVIGPQTQVQRLAGHDDIAPDAVIVAPDITPPDDSIPPDTGMQSG